MLKNLEKKLILALPSKGWLIKPERWNVGDILQRAGIGKYHKEDKHYSFESYDSEIKPITIRPRDIAYNLFLEKFDLGITGKDLIIERGIYNDEEFEYKKVNLNNEEVVPKEICDLVNCYADLVFATTKENWDLIKMNSRIEIINNELELIGSDKYHIHLIHTTYPNLAKVHAKLQGFGKKIYINEVHGATEELLKNGDGDIIFEVMATGESLKDFEILKIVDNSTARLYMGDMLFYSFNNLEEFAKEKGFVEEDYERCKEKGIGGENLYEIFKPALDAEERTRKKKTETLRWKQEKINEIKGKIEDVLKDMDNYCQVRIFLGNDKNSREELLCPHSTTGAWFFHNNFLDYIDQIGYLRFTPEKPNFPYDDFIDFIASKKDFLKIKEFIGNSLEGAIAFNLKEIYAYCPVIKRDFSHDSKDGLHLLPTRYYGKYPLCNVSQLRKEHYEKAVFSSFGKTPNIDILKNQPVIENLYQQVMKNIKS